MSMNEGSGIYEYWSIVKRRKRFILGTLVGCLVMAFALNVLTTPVYRSRVRLEVRRDTFRSQLTGAVTESPSFQSENQTLFTATETITNRALMAEIVTDLWRRGVTLGSGARFRPQGKSGGTGPGGPATRDTSVRSADDTPPPRDLDRQIDWLLARVTTEPLRDTRLIRISVEHSDPRVAATIANMIAEYSVRYLQGQRSHADTTLVSYLRSHAADLQNTIHGLEGRLHDSNQQGLFALEGRGRQLTESIGELNATLTKTKTERLSVTSRLTQLQRVSRDPQRDPDQIPIQSDALDDLRRQLANSNTALAKARVTYGKQHPKLITLESENNEIRRNIRLEITSAVANLNAERSILSGREESLRLAIKQAETVLRSVNAGVQKFSSLEGELKSERELYTLLMARLHEAEINGEIRGPLIRIVEPAWVEHDPVRPRKALNIVLGLLFGLLAGMGVALIQEFLRKTIRTPQDVDQYLHLPIVGLIPKERRP